VDCGAPIGPRQILRAVHALHQSQRHGDAFVDDDMASHTILL
ncbi:MAG: hypothetical protein QG636_457, partial [Patescibacteria group bacterium]|nr:hypothetical protein [Patescibacteria group bacterium]